MPSSSERVLWRWDSWHLHYHQDLDRLIDTLLRPQLEAWLRRNEIDRAYFVRHPLGGPHVRLRVRRTPGTDRDHLDRDLTTAALAFFEREPSARSWSPEAILERNQVIMANDPAESDDAVHSDNSLHRAVFVPEVERYGGWASLEASFDAFHVSTLTVLDVIARRRAMSTPRRGPAFGLLLRWAWGASASADELATLVRYPPPKRFATFAKASERADQIFEQRRDDLVAQVSAELDALLAGVPDPLARAGAALRRAVMPTDGGAWPRIATSHLHMTANRLGLLNAEEIYVSRLVSRTLEAMRTSDELRHEALDAADAGCRGSTETVAEIAVEVSGSRAVPVAIIDRETTDADSAAAP